MHGRKRVGVPPPTPEALAATAKKIEQFKKLSAVVLHHRSARTCSAQALELASQLLAANPDVYTLWNYVREQVLALAGGSSSGCGAAGVGAQGGGGVPPGPQQPPVAALGEAAFAALVAAQLALTAAAIKRNPKSYPAWHHRRWLVEHYRSGRGGAAEGAGAGAGEGAAEGAAEGAGAGAPPPLIPLQGELALCAELLAKDERNFHCWNYRRWVAALGGSEGGASAASELAFTEDKIAHNFSNYSAWHARTCLLQRQWETAQDQRLVAQAATAELTLARKAVFTEPDDQSAWFYRRWVVDSLLGLLGPADGAAEGAAEAGAAAEAALLEDLSALRELSQAEPACKWPLEARAYTLLQLRRRGRAQGTGLEDEQALFQQLEALDPRHAAYYRHIARQH